MIELIEELKKPRARVKIDRPSPLVDYNYLVTEHYGNRIVVRYHGSDQIKFYTIYDSYRVELSRHTKRATGYKRRVLKFWTLIGSIREVL